MKFLKFILFGCFFFFSFCVFAYQGSKVEIVGQKPNWRLLVNGKDFYIKGAGCGKAWGWEDEDYLKLAKDLGANCLRTWGTDQGTKYYLDKAQEYGLMVDAGIWLNHTNRSKISYIGDSQYKKKIRKQTLSYVRKFKTHPAVLMWNVGNEVMIFSSTEEEKIAFCRFLENLVQDIKKIDPNHPVVYAAASYANIKYLKKYVPSLDIVGMNSYGSIRPVQGNWDFLDFNKPYVITEYGPSLPQDRPKDENDRSIELTDWQKASMYKVRTGQIWDFKGCNLGGFVFHLGETTQESMTWWNINAGNNKRLSYWKIYELYTGKPAPPFIPQIKQMELSKIKNISPGEIINVKVKLRGEVPGELNYKYRFSTSIEGVLQYYVNEYINVEVTGRGNEVEIKAPSEKGIYRVYCFVTDRRGNVSSISRTISVD